MHRLLLGPVIVPGCAVRARTAKILDVLEPHEFTAETETFPVKKLLGKVIETTLVPCPPVMVAPGGATQL